MARFKKKPVEVEAVRFTGYNWGEMSEFTGQRNVGTPQNPYMMAVFTPIGFHLLKEEHPKAQAELWVQANESHLPIEIGEWVIKDQFGFYPCKDDGTGQAPFNYGRVKGLDEVSDHTMSCLQWMSEAYRRTCVCDGATTAMVVDD